MVNPKTVNVYTKTVNSKAPLTCRNFHLQPIHWLSRLRVRVYVSSSRAPAAPEQISNAIQEQLEDHVNKDSRITESATEAQDVS